jgi:hypothetical protein
MLRQGQSRQLGMLQFCRFGRADAPYERLQQGQGCVTNWRYSYLRLGSNWAHLVVACLCGYGQWPLCAIPSAGV